MPWYIASVMVFFALFYPLFYGVNSYGSIGVALEPALSFMAMIIFANPYYVEIQQNTEAVFYLLPQGRQRREIGKRILVRMLCTILLYIVSYVLFTFQGVYLHIDQTLAIVMAESFFAVMANIVFFGGISCVAVGLSNNLWKGLGIGVLSWLILGSVWARGLPELINVFLYFNEEGKNWIPGKIFGLIAGIVFFVISTKLVGKSPFNGNKEK